MKKTATLLLTTVILVATGYSQAQAEESTKTVSWYHAHKIERLKVVARCNDNPGELAETPNCVNALRANGAMSWGADDESEKNAHAKTRAMLFKERGLVIPTFGKDTMRNILVNK